MSKSRSLIVVLTLSVLATVLFPTAATAAPPVVDTTISVQTTGSEPFDGTTWDAGPPGTNAGTDEDENNNVVRLQDSITYRIEASVNDTDVANLVSEVLVDKKQKWIEIPTGCQTDLSIYPGLSPVSAIVDSVTRLEGGDERLLICNFGPAIEGTNRVAYPTARVIGASFDGTEITINDDYVGADVSTYADTDSNTATDGPTSVNVTADFRVNLTKSLKIDALDPITNEPLYAPTAKLGPAPGNAQGMLMEYKIFATYQQGSMIADSDEVTFEVDYSIFDYLSDNHNFNNGAETSGALLYTWDPATPGCSLSGDHGANAAVTCTQGLITGDFTSSTGAPGGGNDPTISIDLTDIDVRDPDGDGHLFEIDINIWFQRSTEIEGHQSCVGANAGTTCENAIINAAGVYDPISGTSVGFNPVSTEDASNTNLPNYNGAGEPHPGDTDVPYSLIYAGPGSWSAHKSFFAMDWGSNPKRNDQSAAPGEIIPVMNNLFDYRKLDGAVSQICDKIDQNNFEYVGFSAAPRNDLGYGFNHGPTNPNKILFNGSQGTQYYDGAGNSTYLYSDEPHPTLAELRDDTCDDDVTGDGVVNIMDASGTQSAPGNPVDWYEDSTMVPGGNAGVTKIRWESFYEKAENLALYPDHAQYSMTTNYLVRILPTAVGYGSSNYAPNFISERYNTGPGTDFVPWIVDNVASLDPEDIAFSLSFSNADRMLLEPSSHSILKRTEPEGLKVVRGGDDVDFIIAPQVNGIWDDVNNNTATVTDNLPAGTDYVVGSEMFSTDGGATWLSYTDYQASSPAITITNLTGSGHAAGADPLVWQFGSVENGEQLPLIRYTVHVDDVLVSGTFTNTATIDSPMGIDADATPGPDPKVQTYRLSIFPEFGFDVLKLTGNRVWEVETPFSFELIYKNLGGESYTAGDFIDILPWNGDNTINSGGLQSPRDPGSDFSGTYELTLLDGSNGEVFYATDADPASLSTEVCSADNTPAGYVPVAGDVCFGNYADNGNLLPDGNPAGLGTVQWDLCTTTVAPVTCGSLDPSDITAIRFITANIPTTAGGRSVDVELTPTGNIGGTPDLDADGLPTTASTGDLYTNNFGGRIPENSLRVISNDQTVTMVSGSIGNYLWIDANGDGVQDASEAPLGGVDVALLVEDPNNPGSYIPYQIEDPANPGTFIDYVVTTNADGEYLFDNLPSGNYQVQVDTSTLPPGLNQTYDFDGGGDSTSDISIFGPANPDTANGLTADDYLDVDDNDEQDFGYNFDPLPVPDGNIDIEKATNTIDADTPTGPNLAVDGPVTWTYRVENTSNVPLTDVTVTDDQGVVVSCDVDGNGDPADDATNIIPFLYMDEVVLCEGTGTAVAGQYTNNATVSGTPQHADWTTCGCDPADPDTWPNDPAVYVDATDPDGVAYPAHTDADPSHYFGVDASLDVEKATNTIDADSPTGPNVAPGDPVTWTYVVTNDGNVPLAAVSVTDSQGVVVSCDVDGDGDPANDATNIIPFLNVGASVTCEGAGTATVGQYENTADASGTPQVPDPATCGCDPSDPATWPTDPTLYVDATDENGEPLPPATDADPSHYFGGTPAIDIEKSTNGVDADTPTGPSIAVGDPVTWTYVVTNTGDLPLSDAAVTDSEGVVVSCDVDGDGNSANDATSVIPFLMPGASVTCEGTGVATAGQYSNNATVSGTPMYPDPATCGCDPADPATWPTDPTGYTAATDETGAPLAPVTDEDPSHYFGGEGGIDIEKATNGVDSDTAPGESLFEGDQVIWTYTVTNLSNTAIADATVTDDQGVAVDCGDGTNVIALLAPGASVDCQGVGVVQFGDYANTGAVTGSAVVPNPETCGCDLLDPATWPTDPALFEPALGPDGEPLGALTDEDLSHYTGVPEILAFTGAASTTLVGLGALLVLGGAVLVLITHRRREDVSAAS